MRHVLPNHLHNPFQNRFNVPVTQRHDEMQSYAHMVWQRERDRTKPALRHEMPKSVEAPKHGSLASVYAMMLIFAVAAFILLKVF